MTELETIDRARMYLENMAAGVDPLTGRPVPEGELVRQERIARCLSYAAGVLRQVVENGGVTQPEPKKPFAIRPGALARVEYSSYPLGIMEVCRRISVASLDADMAGLSSKPILNWLEEKGFLQMQLNAEGKNSRRPTEQGRRLGITEAERSGRTGTYIGVVYGEKAQRFIVEHLEEMLAAYKNK